MYQMDRQERRMLPRQVCKKYCQIAGTLFMLLFGALSSSQAATYHLNPDRTSVRFAIDHFNTSTNMGGFYDLNGKFEYDPAAKTGNIALVIPINTINTGNKAFDIELAGPDFFDAQQYPLAAFESTKWYFSRDSNSPKVTRVDGELTLHGETHPVRLTATKFHCSFSHLLKKDVCSGRFTGVIDRTKWHLNKYVILGIAKDLTLNIQIEAIKQ